MAEAEMVICDTNIIVDFFKNLPQIVKEVNGIGTSNVAISTVTAAELFFGALNKREHRKIEKTIAPILNLPITEPVSLIFEQLMKDFSLSHKPGIPDMLIAATAIHHGFELYTLNKKDFRYIPELKLYS